MYLVFDIGGTKLRLSVSEDCEKFAEPYMVETPKSFEEGMRAFKDGFEKLVGGKKITKAAGGIRGVLDKDKEQLINDVHLKDWLGKPLIKYLQEIVGADVVLHNDTVLVGLGEAVRGAGRNYKIVAYLTISTGVGGSKIIDGKIDESVFGFEPGHQIIDLDGSVFPDITRESGGVVGQLEDYISGSAMELRFGKKPYDITDKNIWDKAAEYLAVGLNNTIVHWSPDVVVLGGGMMKSPGISVDTVKTHLGNILKIYPIKPEIKKAELGDFGGLYGGLEILKRLRK